MLSGVLRRRALTTTGQPHCCCRSWQLCLGSPRLHSSGRRPAATDAPFVFSTENYVNPALPLGLRPIDLQLVEATEASLDGFGHLVSGRDERTVENGNFEIARWPQPDWRPLDPGTGCVAWAAFSANCVPRCC